MKIAEIIFQVTRVRGGGFVARALNYGICIQAKIWEELKTMLRDAALCHFGPDEAPQVIRLRLTEEPWI